MNWAINYEKCNKSKAIQLIVIVNNIIFSRG